MLFESLLRQGFLADEGLGLGADGRDSFDDASLSFWAFVNSAASNCIEGSVYHGLHVVEMCGRMVSMESSGGLLC